MPTRPAYVSSPYPRADTLDTYLRCSSKCYFSANVFGVEAKEEDKKDAAPTSSSSVLNLAGIGSLGKEKRQHNGVSALFYIGGSVRHNYSLLDDDMRTTIDKFNMLAAGQINVRNICFNMVVYLLVHCKNIERSANWMVRLKATSAVKSMLGGSEFHIVETL